MSRLIEDRAKDYLINRFRSSKIKFIDIDRMADSGFDIWLEYKETKEKKKIELKATGGAYKRKSNLFEKLYFSAQNEVENFSNGTTLIARVFLGNNPPKIFLIDNSIFKNGAEFKNEFRAKIKGKINYMESISEIETDDA